VHFELRFKDGVLDPDLNSDSEDFPKDTPKGQLPRPPAGWFLKQIDIKNFIEHTPPLDRKVYRAGNDIHLALRYEGDFFENMELENFPFDMQELSLSIAINCRTGGNMPCDLVVADDATIGISRSGFALHQLYEARRARVFLRALVARAPGRPPLAPPVRPSTAPSLSPGRSQPPATHPAAAARHAHDA
jgi:hypothetical protein